MDGIRADSSLEALAGLKPAFVNDAAVERFAEPGLDEVPKRRRDGRLVLATDPEADDVAAHDAKPEDRQKALKKAAEARQKRAALRADIKAGKLSFAGRRSGGGGSPRRDGRVNSSRACNPSPAPKSAWAYCPRRAGSSGLVRRRI